MKTPKLARERGKSRALVFADIIAGLDRNHSVLSLLDRSVVVHFALRLIENVGATPKWENANGNKGRKALLGRTVDETGREQSGVQDIPMDNIFGGPKGSGKAGIQEIGAGLHYLGRRCEEREQVGRAVERARSDQGDAEDNRDERRRRVRHNCQRDHWGARAKA